MFWVSSVWAQNRTESGLGGFTPNPEVSLSFDKDKYPAGTTQSAHVSITGAGNGTYTVNITDEAGTQVASRSLTIGGAPGSNEGDVNIALPATVGRYTYTATVTIGEEPVTDTAKVTLAGKRWDVGTPLTGGDILKPANQTGPITTALVLEQGQEIELEVSAASDSDHWQRGEEEGTDADTVTYKWSTFSSAEYAGVFSSPDATATRWRAPLLPEGLDEYNAQIKITIEDTPKAKEVARKARATTTSSNTRC